MTNDLMNIPNYDERCIKVLISCEEVIKYPDNEYKGFDGEKRFYPGKIDTKECRSIPVYATTYKVKNNRKSDPMGKSLLAYSLQFSDSEVTITNARKISKTFGALKTLNDAAEKDKAFKRFYSIKEETFEPTHIPIEWEYYKLNVVYCVIREGILAYIDNKYGKNILLYLILEKLLEKSKTVNNCKNFEEYVEKKASYLSKLDLSSFVKGLNTETEKIRNEVNARGSRSKNI
jgi:hypothetical protein